MSHFLDGLSDYPTLEEIYGTPEEIIQGARTFPELPLETLWARCLRCSKVHGVGRFVYKSELVTLPDGSSTTAEDWWKAAAVAAYMRGERWKFPCPVCDQVTSHIAEKG